MRSVAVLAFLVATSGASAASGAETAMDPMAELTALCQRVLCRAPKVSLRTDGTTTFESHGPAPLPVLQQSMISVYPGETVFVEATVKEGRIQLERAVSSNQTPERTLRFSFSQISGKKDMLLEVANPFLETLRFRMGLMRPDSDALHDTSSCPVRGGLSLYEHWPFPIFQLLITDARVLTSSDSLACQ